ncbi:unnamed protein product, partial [Rotaria socialis]
IIMSGGPNSWSQFVGKKADDAESHIKSEGFNTEVMPEGAPCTRDFRPNRVRIFVDTNNVVVATPHTG